MLGRRKTDPVRTGAGSRAGGRIDSASSEGRPSGAGSGGERIPGEVARRIRLVVLDVDGVLTDAGVYLGEDADGNATEFKRFNIQDGLGLVLLREAGVEIALVSGRVSAATTARARELGIEECHQVPGARKLPVVRGILERHGLEWDEVAMLGDDLPDLPVFRRIGLPVAVGNAVSEVRREAVWTTRRDGGYGAVREFAKVLLQARGEWDALVERYVEARSGENDGAARNDGGSHPDRADRAGGREIDTNGGPGKANDE